MKTIHFNFQHRLSRRAFLRGAGVALTLPWLEAMRPAFGKDAAAEAPRRFVSITDGLGLHAPNLFPEQAGFDYQPSLYLQPFADLRRDLTIVSGASHPGVSGAHRSELSVLTGAPVSGGGPFRNTVSLDQYMARRLGQSTRFPSLALGVFGETSPSYTEGGAMIPAEISPARLFARLFIADSPAEQQRRVSRANQGRSIMDLVGADAKSLQKQLGPGDRDKVDAYFTSVRELEGRLAASADWAAKPKPRVDAKPPEDVANLNDIIARQRLLLDVAHLALQTDCTRFITVHTSLVNPTVPVEGVTEGYHNLSHHGQDEAKIAQLTRVEQAIFGVWGGFVRKLKQTGEGGGTLLDRTMVLLTSNLGNASSHDSRNMPVILAGGGFKHGQHLAFDRTHNEPLPNLYLALLQRMGLEADKFATSTGTLRGLELS